MVATISRRLKAVEPLFEHCDVGAKVAAPAIVVRIRVARIKVDEPRDFLGIARSDGAQLLPASECPARTGFVRRSESMTASTSSASRSARYPVAGLLDSP